MTYPLDIHKSSRTRQNRRNEENLSGHYHPTKNDVQYEENYSQENQSETAGLKKNKNGGRKQERERKDRNKEVYNESHGVVYYVKKSQTEEQQRPNEEQKEGKRRYNNRSSQKAIEEEANTTEAPEKKEEKGTTIDQSQAQLSEFIAKLRKNFRISSIDWLELNQRVETEGIRGPESGVKSTSLLLNEQDKVSQIVPKPVIDIPAPSETQSTAGNAQSAQDDRDVTSVNSDTET